jgi:hypothetical protein
MVRCDEVGEMEQIVKEIWCKARSVNIIFMVLSYKRMVEGKVMEKLTFYYSTQPESLYA